MKTGRMGWRHLGLALLFFGAVALLLTYPVSVQISSHLAGVPGQDAMQHLWISWWTQKSLLDLGTSPAQVGWLYYPDGAANQMLWVTPYPQIAGLPLSLLFGPVTAYNMHLLASFVLSALSSYLLVLYLTRNRTAALIGGLVYAIFPNRMAQSTAHFAQVIAYFFPLCLLYLIKLKRQPNLRHGLIFGLFLGCSLLVNIVHIAYFLLPALVVFIGYWAITERSRLGASGFWRYLAAGLLLAAAISAPFLVAFVQRSFTGQLDYLSQGGVTDFSADLLAFFVPAASHPLLNAWPGFRDFANRLVGSGNLRENTVYLGIIPLALAAWGLARWQKARTLPWLILALVAAVLSLGPVLKVAGNVTGWPLPYAAVQFLPFYKWGRIPGRFNETIILGLAVLAGYGYASLSGRRKGRRTVLLAAVCIGAIGFEYLTIWPFPTLPAATPAFYQQWANDKADFGVLDLPQWPLWLREASNYAMFNQTVHGHKIVGGYVWRMPQGRDGTMKAFQELLWPDGQTDIIARRRGAEAVPLLNQYGIRYVVVHPRTMPPEDVNNDIATITRALGAPFYSDPDLVAFAVPPAPPSPGALEPLTTFSYNWYMVEPIDGKPARWLNNDGTLHVHWLQEPATPYELSFTAAPFRQPRRLQVSVNGQDQGSVLVSDRQTVTFGPLALHKGQNDIQFHVVEGCDIPADTVPGNEDHRCLSLLFQDMQLSPIATPAPEKTP